MVFSSVVFLCFFLPVVFCLHRLLPGIRLKNAVLTLASLLFYAYGEPVFVFYLIFLVFVHFLVGKIARKKGKFPLPLFVLLLILDVLTLFVFKYAGFFVESINGIFGLALPVPDIALPIGISFFTFQIMSYAIDAWRDNRLIQEHFSDLLLYISFFPQLIAGPIVRYTDIAAQLKERHATPLEEAQGLRRFIIGLAKKVLISNAMAVVADALFTQSATENLAMPQAWLASAAYGFQIYYDFSGYSDMAIGMGHMFGFHFLENFNYPYTADSVTDFWRRWHISLTTWFRQYVYIPLGGNRKGKKRTIFNIFIIFLLTGLWHGANWTFLVWGLYYAVFMIAERLQWIPTGKIHFKPIKWLYTIFVVFTGFVIFRANTISQAWHIICSLFDFSSLDKVGFSGALSYLDFYTVFILFAAILFSGPWAKQLWNKCKDKKYAEGLSYVGAVVLLAVCMVFLVTDSYNPFIYFNF